MVPWLHYVNGGIKPTGADFSDAVRSLCRLVGISYPERDRTPEELAAAERGEARRSVLEDALRL